ncbi:MAG: M1 family aminopeptidase [Gemmataceae bacterium]
MSGRCLVGFLAVLVLAGTARAQTPPPDLPHYDMHVSIDPAKKQVHLQERVTWTNRHARPTNELVLAVYPLFKVPDKDFGLLAKTVEILRQTPSEALLKDAAGKTPTAHLASDGRPLNVLIKPDNQTTIVIPLPMMVHQGESVTVDIAFDMQLSEVQGRWGQWQGVTFLTNWHPTLCFYDDHGWQPTPFIPWHQPFFNEAGCYTATITLPTGQVLAAPSQIVSERDCGGGLKEVILAPAILRDFALVTSDRFQVLEGTAGGVKIRVVHLPEHHHYARVALRVASEAIPVYSQWFGPYPYPQFTVAEAFFPWNGNECAGMVWLDHRVFQLPEMAEAYVDYLLSHEIAHQWWYNLVGTNGYAETFMDEAPATYFSHRLIDRKVGKNNNLIKYPNGLGWMPNIRRENYRYATWLGSVRRGEAGPAVQPMDQYAHVYELFAGAYDRGSRLIMMIEDKLGETAFLDFTRIVVRKYSFRILRVADYQRELEEYTGRSWKEFFDQWAYGHGLTDWQVESVRLEKNNAVEITVRQTREIDEPTVVGVKLAGGDGYAIRVPINPRAGVIKIDNPPCEIEPIDEHAVRVRMQLPSEPAQISVDPDAVLPDADPTNNHWKSTAKWRFTPLYTQLDDADMTNDYDCWNFQAGPYVYAAASQEPWYARSVLVGLRAGAVRTQEFSGGAFLAYRNDFHDIVAGADAFVDHVPFPKTQLGFHVEKRVAGPFATEGPNDVTRAVLYSRYVFAGTASTYMNPMHYAEIFTTYQDNAMPFARRPELGAVRWDHSTTAGIHWSLDYLTPYWDPEGGFKADLSYQGGVADLDESRVTHRFDGEFTFVKTPPSWTGPLSNTRIAMRGAAAYATPRDGLFYALGGSTLFRGFDLAERQGNALWVTNIEWRIPLVRHIEWDTCDHIAGLRGIYLAPFYDVGAIYVDGRQVSNVAHAVGVGLRWDVAWFSFIERSVIRLDVAKTINESSPVQLWIGFLHAF